MSDLEFTDYDQLDEPVARRHFLKQLAAGTTAALMAGEPTPLTAAEHKVEHPAPTADSVILIWMAGGMAAPETFDPKRFLGTDNTVLQPEAFVPFGVGKDPRSCSQNLKVFISLLGF